MEYNVIPIAMITDNNYVMPTVVCLESLFRNKNSETKYCVYIITDNIDSDKSYLLQNYSKENFEVNVISLDNQYKNLQNKNDYVTNAAFLKFDIPNTLKQYDKILYIDTDTVVLKDLTALYNIELADTYAGVILDVGDIFYKFHKTHNLKQYFNSGVILFNAKKYRDEHMAEKLLKIYVEAGQSFICHDQDTFNIGFNNNITILPPKFNHQQSIYEYPPKKIEAFYGVPLDELINESDIYVLHYTRMKPWLYNSASKQKIWLFYYKNSILGLKPLKLKQGIFLKYYFIIRSYLNIKFINDIVKKLKKVMTRELL